MGRVKEAGSQLIEKENIIEGKIICLILNDDIPKHADVNAEHTTRHHFRQCRNAQIATSKNCSIERVPTVDFITAAPLSPRRKPNKQDTF